MLEPRRFTNYDFGFSVRPTLRLCRVEEILKKSRLIDPVPSRRNLISLIEEGKLEGRSTDYGWIVYEDSFLAWCKSFQTVAA